MGSSSSTQKSPAKTPDSATPRPSTGPPQKLIGSSTPPKGPPKSRRNGSAPNATKPTQQHAGTKHVSIQRAKNQDGTKGVKDDASAEDKHNNNRASVKASPNDEERSDTRCESRKRAISAKRLKSASMRQDTRKDIMRKLEKGIEDENVDSVLGLTRMNTKMKLRRERTLMKEEMEEDTRRKSVNTYQRALKKVRRLEPPSSEAEIYMGNANIDCPPRARIVRIFTSSTFTDTMHERNTLMKEAYPRVKAFCQGLGYDFQVVDMRWGIRDQATDDNMTTEICLRELQMCQKLSTGPYFVVCNEVRHVWTLVSHKYGYTDFPRCINADELETMLDQITDTELVSLFHKWYKKDFNAQPPAYVVCPISQHLPDFLSPEREKKDVAKKQWWAESERLQAALEDVAARVFDAATARKYIRSVSETEIQMGLLEARDPAKQCLWLRRTIDDLDKQEASYLLSRYTESTFNNSEEKVQKSQQMLTELKEKGIRKVLPQENIMEFSVKWNKEKGIDPDKDEAHASYLKKMSKEFVTRMCRLIKEAVEDKKQTEDKLVDEIVQHVQFCQEKCLTFHGRNDVLKRAERYLNDLNNEPLVLHGDSGSGKTSLMAMLAQQAWTWMDKKATIVIRFIGTTPASTTLHGLLHSVTSQNFRSYGVSGKVSKDLRTLIEEFESSLQLATSEHPLVLILDSLDTLDPSHSARHLQWLPRRLRSNIKVIVSTLPGPQYEAFPVLQSTIHTKENLIEIPRLPDSDASSIVDAWLAMKNRTLTKQQKSVVLDAFKKCPLPLFLKLAVDKASAWASYTPQNQTVLESTIRASIDNLFERLEKIHGHIFVSRALGYLSSARVGLTETELEDVLSCDDDVLNDVYMYWTPPIRRLPPLLLVRLRADLSQYLVDRGANNVRVMFWYHRQFLEAAQNRYCGNNDIRQKLHIALADFFAGTWADGKEKPYTSSKGDKGEADRHVASQPNRYGSTYNLRKLSHLPYHRCHARQLNKLKSECLANFEFLLHKLTATSLWQIMDDFALALTTFSKDELLKNISDVLQLSQTGLLYDPNQLASQLIGRLPQSKVTERFLDECHRLPVPALLADKRILTQPGGQLLHCMAGHKGDILSLDLTTDSGTALTCSDDGTVRLWDTQTGKQIRMLDGLGKLFRASFCNHDKSIHIVTNNKHSIRTASSGEKLFDIPTVTDDCPSCVTGPGKSQLVIFKDNTAMVYSAVDGSLKTKIECGGDISFKFPAFAVGSKNYAAITTEDQIYATVLDISKTKFSPLFRGFEPFKDEDIGEEIQYEIDEMTITADEKFLVYSNVYTNDIVFLDFRAQKKTQVIKGNPNDYIRSLRCSPDNRHLYLAKAAFVNVLDLRTKSPAVEELEHTVDVVGVATHDMKTVVTAGEDSNVRVWDRTRKAQSMSQNPGVTAHKIRLISMHENPRYIVGFGFKNKDGDSQFLFVYDVIKNCTVRERLLDCSILQCEMLGTRELLVLHDIVHRLCTIDIDTMKVTRVFQGYLPNTNWAFKVIRNRNEVASLSFGRRNVKVYDLSTGRCAAILPSGQREKLDGLVVNDEGTVLVTWCEGSSSGPVLIYDLVRRKQMRVLTPKGLFITEGEIALSPDGSMLLFKVEGVPPGAKQKHLDDEVYLEAWDVLKGSRVSSLVDLEYYLRYQGIEDKTGSSSGVDVFQILDNRRVLVAHDDYVMRVFDMHTGAILQRVSGHCTGIEIVQHGRDSPYVLTYGSWTEENSLRLWNKADFTCVTSYTLDKTVTLLNWSADGKFLLATTGKPAEIVTWKFNNFEPSLDANPDTYTVLLQGQDLQGYIDLVPDDENVTIDPNDLDKDIPSDDSEDDDDDML